MATQRVITMISICVLFLFHSPWPQHRSILYIVLGQVGIRCGWSFQRVSFHKTGVERRSVPRFSYRQTHIFGPLLFMFVRPNDVHRCNIFRAISWSLLSFCFILLKISLFFFPSRIFIRSHSNISIWDAYEPKGV